MARRLLARRKVPGYEVAKYIFHGGSFGRSCSGVSKKTRKLWKMKIHNKAKELSKAFKKWPVQGRQQTKKA